jgi:hypothetical protein
MAKTQNQKLVAKISQVQGFFLIHKVFRTHKTQDKTELDDKSP